jgi:hypothetical protein
MRSGYYAAHDWDYEESSVDTSRTDLGNHSGSMTLVRPVVQYFGQTFRNQI